MRKNNDGSTGFQQLMKIFNKNLNEAKVQGNER